MKLYLLAVILCSAIVYGANVPSHGDFQLPEGTKTCDLDDPELNNCIKDAIQYMLPKLHKGNKQLGIPPIDPFPIENTRFDYTNAGIQGSLALKGVKMYGLSRAQVKNANMNVFDKGLTSEIELYLPRVFIEGGYKGDVKINDIKMNAKGYFNITMGDVRVIHKIGGLFETIEGVKHLRLNSWDMIPEVGAMKVYASGLLPDPQLNTVVLDFVNEYWPEIYRFLLPESRPQWEPILLNAANQFLQTVPIDKILTKNAQ